MRTKQVVRQAMVVAVALASRHVAVGAQGVAVDTIATASVTSCGPEVPDRSYQRCGLHFERGSLRMGTGGKVIDRPGLFTPVALSRFVSGDSAIHYASRYERSA